MYSQIDIRYSVSQTIAAVKAITNAFPGDVTLCLENKTLYQYVEYADGATVPSDDGNTVLQTVNTELTARWVAISAYTGKSFIGSFTNEDWVEETDGAHYSYTIVLPNKVTSAALHLYDSQHVEVYPETIEYVRDGSGINSIKLIIGAIPDCRFEGTYSIFFDSLI